MNKQFISIVVPIYNEQDVLLDFYQQLIRVIDILPYDFEILFINDGSNDRSDGIIRDICTRDKRVKQILFSRNFGHQAALTAGLDFAAGDAVICMDGDLQHPPGLIPQLVDQWKQGYDVVFTIRKKTAQGTLFKYLSAKMFYRLINSISRIHIDENAPDFRLLSRKVTDIFKKDIRERNRFIRGLVNWVGFHNIGIEFNAGKRMAGKTKYNMSKMFNFASSGIVSFSTVPLRFGIYLGIFFGIGSIGYGIFAIIMALFTNRTVPGWTSILAMVAFIGAIQFFLIGLLGEYIGYIFEEVKGRPNYIIQEKVNFNDN